MSENTRKDMRVKFLVFIPSLDIRESKLAYTINHSGYHVEIYTEHPNQSKVFTEMLKGVPINKLHALKTKYLYPVDIRLNRQITSIINQQLSENDRLFIIARDVIYGYIIGKILKKQKMNANTILITDIADNYDLAYDAYNNIISRKILKFVLGIIFTKAMELSDLVFVVCQINKERILENYSVDAEDIYVLRNLPLIAQVPKPAKEVSKIDKSIVYVGRVDNLARDLETVLKTMVIRNEWFLHLYSEEKKQVIKNLRDTAEQLKVANRMIVHELMPYEKLHEELRRYQIGIIPHKRNVLTDYTVPNKLYDYLLSNIIIVASDNPSILEESKYFSNIYTYKGEDHINLAILLDEVNTKSIYPIEKNNLDWEHEFIGIFRSIFKKLNISM